MKKIRTQKILIVLLLFVLTAAGILLLMPDSAKQAFGHGCGSGNVSQMIYSPDSKQNKDDGRPVIVLDPGHGGRDPGAVNKALGLREADINLQIAQELAVRLSKSGKFAVYLTHGELGAREKMTLEERVDCAVDLNAGLFISLHNNSEDSASSGAEIYYSGRDERSSFGAYLLAEQIMIGFGENGMRLRGIYNRMSEVANSDEEGRLYDYYGVIRMCSEHDIPALLVEHGFLNAHDAPFISTPEAVSALAESEYHAIMRWYGYEAVPGPKESSGDGDGNGTVDEDDMSLALSAVMCEADSPAGLTFRRLDTNGDWQIDSADVSFIFMRSNGIECMREKNQDPPEQSVTSDKDDIKKGDKITVTVTFSGRGELLSAAGVINYDKKAFRLDSIADKPDNLLYSEDKDFGLVRWCLYPDDAVLESESDPSDFDAESISFVFQNNGDGSGGDGLFSINSNIYSSSYYDSSAKSIITRGRSLESVVLTKEHTAYAEPAEPPEPDEHQ